MRVGEIFETKWGNTYRRWKIVRSARADTSKLCLIMDYTGMKAGEFLTVEDEHHIAGTSDLFMPLLNMAQAATMY